jgi:ABC-type nitrate/sulfonate/bicarbonate transport system permease component
MSGLDGRWLATFVPVAVLLALWHVAVVTSGSLIFPTPWQVVVGLVDLARQGLLLKHVVASLFRVTYGYLLAAALAIPVGMLMGRFATAHALLNPLVQGLRPISPIAWIPLTILWFGVGDLSPIFLIFLSSFFPMVVGTAAGVMTIDRKPRNMSGMMMMERIPKIALPPRGRVELKPGGYHLMLMGLKRALSPGQSVTLTLVFERAGPVTIRAEVR